MPALAPQVCFHCCLALQQWLRAHLALQVQRLRRSLSSTGAAQAVQVSLLGRPCCCFVKRGYLVWCSACKPPAVYGSRVWRRERLCGMSGLLEMPLGRPATQMRTGHRVTKAQQHSPALLAHISCSSSPHVHTQPHKPSLLQDHASYKPIDVSNEALDSLVSALDTDRRLAEVFARARWPALESLVDQGGLPVLLELVQYSPQER